MVTRFTAACLQLNSKRNIKDNIAEITTLLDDAIETGADFITLPECTGLMEPNAEALREKAPVEEALKGKSGVVGLDNDNNGLLGLIDFNKIKGGKPFDPKTTWFQKMLTEIGQISN